MMRISREEEHYIGRARPGFQGRMKVGFAKDGPHHGAGHVRHLRTTARTTQSAMPNLPAHCFAAISAPGDALARRDRTDEHASARGAKLSGRHAGNRHHGADPGESRAQARRRPGGDPTRSTLPRARRRSGRRATASAATPPALSSRRRSIAAQSSSSGRSG